MKIELNVFAAVMLKQKIGQEQNHGNNGNFIFLEKN
jgi:hypothetical protein